MGGIARIHLDDQAWNDIKARYQRMHVIQSDQQTALSQHNKNNTTNAQLELSTSSSSPAPTIRRQRSQQPCNVCLSLGQALSLTRCTHTIQTAVLLCRPALFLLLLLLSPTSLGPCCCCAHCLAAVC